MHIVGNWEVSGHSASPSCRNFVLICTTDPSMLPVPLIVPI